MPLRRISELTECPETVACCHKKAEKGSIAGYPAAHEHALPGMIIESRNPTHGCGLTLPAKARESTLQVVKEFIGIFQTGMDAQQVAVRDESFRRSPDMSRNNETFVAAP